VSAVTNTHGDVARLGVGLEPAQHVVAAHRRHHHVEQDQVGRVGLAAGQFERRGAFQRHLDPVVGTQRGGQHVQVGRHVVDDQHQGLALHHRHLSVGRPHRWHSIACHRPWITSRSASAAAWSKSAMC
jgi:hypothetical protein